jgi:hypothetical protein
MIGVERHVVVARGGEKPAAAARLKDGAGNAEGTNAYFTLLPIETAELGTQSLVAVEKNRNKHELFMQPASSQRQRVGVVASEQHRPGCPARASAKEIQGEVPLFDCEKQRCLVAAKDVFASLESRWDVVSESGACRVVLALLQALACCASVAGVGQVSAPD